MVLYMDGRYYVHKKSEVVRYYPNNKRTNP